MEKIYLVQSVFKYVVDFRTYITYTTHRAFSTEDDAYDYLDEHGDCISAYLESINPHFSYLTIEELVIDDFSCEYCQHDEEDDEEEVNIEELQRRINELEKDIEKLRSSISTDDDDDTVNSIRCARCSKRGRRLLDI